MSDVLFHAPARGDNAAGPREFAYLAEVDILGWKFRVLKDGQLVIDTPEISEDVEVGSSFLCVLTRDRVALLTALLALADEASDAPLPSHWSNVGRVVQ